jgi:hypothetical protein
MAPGENKKRNLKEDIISIYAAAIAGVHRRRS